MNKGVTLYLMILIIILSGVILATSQENSEALTQVPPQDQITITQSDSIQEENTLEIQLNSEENIYLQIEEVESIGQENLNSDSNENEIYIDLSQISPEEEINNSKNIEKTSTNTEILPLNETKSLLEQNISINQTKIRNIVKEFDPNESIQSSNQSINESVSIQEFISGSKGSSNDQEFQFVNIENISSQESINDSYLKINFTIYSNHDGKTVKEIETQIGEDDQITIKKLEEINQENNIWKKEVEVFSTTHHEIPVIVYTDIIETENNIEIFWQEENKFISFEEYDNDKNGLTERISWIVPHLSSQNFQILINTSTNFINKSIFLEMNISQNDLNLTLNISQNDSNSTINFSSINISYLANSSIDIEIIRSPQGTFLSGAVLTFDFNVTSININSTDQKCVLMISNLTEVIFHAQINEAYLINSSNLPNTKYDWLFNCQSISMPNINASKKGNFTVEVYYPPVINFISNKNSINQGESVSFFVNISSATIPPRVYIVNFGDGSFNITSFNTINHYQEIKHTYNQAGNFNISLTGNIYNETLSYQKQLQVFIVNQSDTEKPVLSLKSPSSDENIRLNSTQDKINFTYEISDNVNISNCTLNIYFYNNSIIGSLVYYSKKENLGRNASLTSELFEFVEGEYSYDVECFDTSSNSVSKTRDFEISYKDEINVTLKTTPQQITTLSENNDPQIVKVDSLINQINDFIIVEERYSQEEKEVVEDLEILDDLKAYKKKLLQIKLDLDHNLDNFRDATQKEERIRQINEDISLMEDSIPTDIEVIDSKEFTKNNIDFDGQEVSKAYLETYQMDSSQKKINSLDKNLQKSQGKVRIEVDTKVVSLSYNQTEKEITIIKKTISSSNQSFDSYFEVIPKTIAENVDDITFINDFKVIKIDPIVEIKSSNLKDNQIIYYIDKKVDLALIENTNTISFEESLLTSQSNSPISSISGFAIFGNFDGKSIGFYFSWILLLIIILAILLSTLFRFKSRKCRKKPEVKKILADLKEVDKSLDSSDISRASSLFERIKQDYNLIPEHCKKFLDKKINKVEAKLNKKLLSSLIKEFISAVDSSNKVDALNLYSKISNLYQKMPPKIKKKAYDKILPYVQRLN